MTPDNPPIPRIIATLLAAETSQCGGFFALAPLLFGLLCTRASWLQPNPLLQPELAWVSFSCWPRRWQCSGFADIQSLQLDQLQSTR